MQKTRINGVVTYVPVSKQNQQPAPPPPPPITVIPRNFKPLSGHEADDLAEDAEDEYDINTTQAILQYIRRDTDAAGYNMAQNMNHKLENGLPLNANEQFVSQQLIKGAREIGVDTVLTRAAHKDFLEALGVQNYASMTNAQLDAAVKGAEYTEKKFVSASFDPSRNPFISGPVSGGREVFIKIKTPSNAKGVHGDKSQTEFIFAPGVKFRAIGAHFDNTTAYPRNGGALPRVVVEVEIIT